MSGTMMCLKLSGWKGHQVVSHVPLVVFVCFVFPSFCFFSNWKSQRKEVLISDHDLNNNSGNLTACINLLLPMWCKGENWGEDGRSGQLWPQPGADVEADHVDNQPTKGQPWPRPQPKPGAGHLRCGGQPWPRPRPRLQPQPWPTWCAQPEMWRPWPMPSQVPPWWPSISPPSPRCRCVGLT